MIPTFVNDLQGRDSRPVEEVIADVVVIARELELGAEPEDVNAEFQRLAREIRKSS